ncbi:hypothetical protein BDZ89DRAFT_1056899 [Hymenopellis radicata]|nr:hypothetical protein BDZ89DRAFT_1056899 [Hymenopellis radicata]
MASLSEHIDRLSKCTKGIETAAQAVSGSATTQSFTFAVLHTKLGDLIREIDDSEIGLFSVVVPSTTQERDSIAKAVPELARNEFQVATPLRRAPTRRDDGSKDLDPEAYAHAALKYIHRYQPIRAMPRAYSQVAEIIDRIEQTRLNIQQLTQSLESQVSDQPSLKSAIDREEHEVHGLEQQVTDLRKRRDALQAKKGSRPTARTTVTKKKPPPPKRPITPVAADDPAEESFWSTPTAAAAVGGFNLEDNLLNEAVDFGNTSIVSNSSPVSNSNSEDAVPQIRNHIPSRVKLKAEEALTHYPPAPSPSEPDPDPDVTPHTVIPPETPRTTAKLRINAEVERIVVKIWTTMGDTIMPGHPFETGSSGDGPKPPRAKETIAHLRSVASQIPSPVSPSDSSLSSASAVPSQPTSQQILTAHLLVSLLSAAPSFSMPLNKVKDVLSNKAASCGNSALIVGQGATRIVYNCVAKRLIKIERGRGEQTVMFNV